MAEPVKVAGYALDVVVPTHGRLDITMSCLKALYDFTRTPFHLIVVDDSVDLTPLYLTQFCKEHDNVTYIHSNVPYRCGNQIFNKGLEHCKTPFMATVMNSLRVEPNWEDGGLQVLNSDPKIGLVGFKSLFWAPMEITHGSIESAFIKMNKYLPCDVGRHEPGHRLAFVMPVDAVQWAFAMVRVEAAKGNLGENTFNGFRGWDDIDNCFVLKSKGWKIFYCGASVGYHEPRATRGDNSAKADQENRENGIAFYKRWGFWDEFVQQHGAEAEIHTWPKATKDGAEAEPKATKE